MHALGPGRDKSVRNRNRRTTGTDSSAETTIDDIQIATMAEDPYTRAVYELSESNYIRQLTELVH